MTTHLQRHVYETFFWYFLFDHFFILYFLCIFHKFCISVIEEYGAIVLLLDFSWANCCLDPTEQIPGVLKHYKPLGGIEEFKWGDQPCRVRWWWVVVVPPTQKKGAWWRVVGPTYIEKTP